MTPSKLWKYRVSCYSWEGKGKNEPAASKLSHFSSCLVREMWHHPDFIGEKMSSRNTRNLRKVPLPTNGRARIQSDVGLIAKNLSIPFCYIGFPEGSAYPAIHPGSILSRSSGLNRSHVLEHNAHDQFSFPSSHVESEKSNKSIFETCKFSCDNQVSVHHPPCSQCCLEARKDSKVLTMEKERMSVFLDTKMLYFATHAFY